jgi:ABC-type protease/lipase transport system fused ATPase/permease subunit
MHPDNPLRIAIKYLSFIAPPIILFLCFYFLFHNIEAAIILTVIIMIIFVFALAWHVSNQPQYEELIKKTERNAKYKVYSVQDKIINALNKKR